MVNFELEVRQAAVYIRNRSYATEELKNKCLKILAYTRLAIFMSAPHSKFPNSVFSRQLNELELK